MGRLDKCLDINSCPKELADHIVRERQKYIDDGYEPIQAKVNAVKDALESVDTDIEHIVSNILKQSKSYLDFGPAVNRNKDLGINDRDTVLNELYEDLGDNLGRLQARGALNIVESINDVEGEPIYSKDGVPVAFYEDGVITLIASNIPKGEAKNIMLHEGFHKAMGEDPMLMAMHDKVLYEFSRLIGKSKSVDAAYRQVPEDTDKSMVDEEALAYFLQSPSNRKTNIFRKILSNIKAYFVRIGFNLSLVNEADFVALAEQSIKAVYASNRDVKTGKRSYSKLVTEKFKSVYQQKVIKRENLKENPDVLYLFGDNDKRAGKGGQAKEMRGEPNAVGIRTKAAPSMDNNAFWSDDTLELNREKIDADLAPVFKHIANGGLVIVPANGIGSGFAKLRSKAPLTFKYLQKEINRLKGTPQTQAMIAKRNRVTESLKNRLAKQDERLVVDGQNKNALPWTRNWNERSKGQQKLDRRTWIRDQKNAFIDSYFPSGVLESEADRAAFIERNSREAVREHIDEYKSEFQRSKTGLTAFVDYLDRFYPDENTEVAGKGRAVNRGLKENAATLEGGSSITMTEDEKKWYWIKPISEKIKDILELDSDASGSEVYANFIQSNINSLVRLHKSLSKNKYFNTRDPYVLRLDYMKTKMKDLSITEDMSLAEQNEKIEDLEDFQEAIKASKASPSQEQMFKDAMHGKLHTLADYVVYSLAPYASQYSINNLLSAVKSDNGLYKNWRAFPETINDLILFLENKKKSVKEAVDENVDNWITEDAQLAISLLGTKAPQLTAALNDNPENVYEVWDDMMIPNMVENTVSESYSFNDSLNDAVDLRKEILTQEFGVSKEDADIALRVLNQVFWLQGKESYQKMIKTKETGRNSSISRKPTAKEKAALEERERMLDKPSIPTQILADREWDLLKKKNYSRANSKEIRQIVSALKGLSIKKEGESITLSEISQYIINDEKVSPELKKRLEEEHSKTKSDQYKTIKDVLKALSFLNNPWVQEYAGLPTAEATEADRGTLPDEQDPYVPEGTDKIVNRRESSVFLRNFHTGEYTVKDYISSSEYADTTKFILERAYNRGFIHAAIREARPNFSDQEVNRWAEQVYSRNPAVITKFDVAYADKLLDMANEKLESANSDEKRILNALVLKYKKIMSDTGPMPWDKKSYKTFEEKQLKTRNKLNFDVMDAKAMIASDLLATEIPVDAKFFEDMSERLASQNIKVSPVDLFIAYKESSTETHFKTRITRMIHNRKLASAVLAFDANEYTDPETRAAAERAIADEYSYNPRGGDQVNNSFRSLILSELSKRNAAYGIIPDLISQRWKHVDTGAVFKPFIEGKIEEDLAAKRQVIRGEMRRARVQSMYSDIADSMDADIEIIDDPTKDIQSGFTPKSESERAKFVINVSDTPRTGKIIAQEAFFRVVDSLSETKHKDLIDTFRWLGDPNQRTNIDYKGLEGLKSQVFSGDRNSFDELMYKKFEDNPSLDSRSIESMAAAEVFAYYSGNPSFHKVLSDQVESKGLTEPVAEIYVNLVENLNKLSSFVEGGKDQTAVMLYENRRLVMSSDIDSIYEMIADLIGGPELRGKSMSSTSNSVHRAYAKLGMESAANEIRTYARKPIKPVNGFWKKLFKPGTKNYKGLMTNIEHMIRGIFEWSKRKPKKVFADWLAEPIDTKLASYVQHGYEQEFYRAQTRIEKYKRLFNQIPDDDLAKLHDRIVRGLRYNSKTKLYEKVTPLDFTKQADVETALKEGIPQDFIDVYKIYKEESDALYEKLKEHYPELKYRPAHYGQSLKWVKENGNDLNAEFYELMYPDRSAAEGRKQFLEEKDTDHSTSEIANKFKAKPQSLNPNSIFLEYIKDANKLIKTKEMISDGIIEGRIKIFADPRSAEREGFYPVDDPAFEITTYGEQKDINIGTRVLLRNGNSVKVIGTFPTEESANDFIKANPKKGFEIAPATLVSTGEEVVARYYFKEDLAGMLGTVYAKDYFKAMEFGALTGKKLLKAKNWTTAIEFAFSMFHAMTIGQEHLASSLSWKIQKEKGIKNKIKSIANPLSVFRSGLRDARDIRVLFDEYHKNTELANDQAFIDKFNSILGTDNMDVVDMIDKFFMVGGRPHQDPELRAGAYAYGEMKYRSNTPILKKVGDQYVIASENENSSVFKDIAKSVNESLQDVHDDISARYPDRPVANMLRTMSFAGTQATTAWLMESGIPKIKMAMWFKEYSQKLKRYEKEIADGTILKEHLAHETMKFIEDRFGEVNWKNQWMNPSYKSALIFLFRSFTWFTGSWKALSKAGIDVGKLMWFKAKGEHYELTEKGWWGVNAVISHMLVAGLFSAAYMAMAGIDDDDVEDDKDVDLLSRLLFPRINTQDPHDRVTIPSYVTEAYKIFHHLGILGNNFEPLKLISGRFNSLVGNAAEIWQGQDFRGVEIRNSHDPIYKQGFDSALHLFAVAPIAVSSVMDDIRREGFRPEKFAYAFMGMTDAPAVAKRSKATSYAFDLTRQKFSSMVTEQEDADLRDKVSRAAFKFSEGEREPLNNLLYEGDISVSTYKNAIARMKKIDGKANPLYKIPILSAMNRLSIEEAMDVWSYMTDNEKELTKPFIVKKYLNIVGRKSGRSNKSRQEAYKRMKELKIL